MRKLAFVFTAICVLAGLGVGSIALANKAVDGDDPAIMVSPRTLVLGKADSVTVHSNIPAAAVIASSVTLNGVAPLAVWADDCGHLAARFAVADLDLAAGDATLTLCGAYTGDAGGTFAASAVVRVK